MAEQKMSVGEASGIFSTLKNQYKAAERLEEACAVVLNLEAEVSRLKKEQKEADDARAVAIRDRAAAESELKEILVQREKAAQAHKDALQAEAQGLVRFQQQCAKETDRIRAEHVEQQREIADATAGLEAKRGNLARVVRELEHPPGEPEGSSQARVEP